MLALSDQVQADLMLSRECCPVLDRCPAKVLEKKAFSNGGRTRARTWDPLIKSQLLYQLSYAPGTCPETILARGPSFSKAIPLCPASWAIFPDFYRLFEQAEGRRIPAAFQSLIKPLIKSPDEGAGSGAQSRPERS